MKKIYLMLMVGLVLQVSSAFADSIRVTSHVIRDDRNFDGMCANRLLEEQTLINQTFAKSGISTGDLTVVPANYSYNEPYTVCQGSGDSPSCWQEDHYIRVCAFNYALTNPNLQLREDQWTVKTKDGCDAIAVDAKMTRSLVYLETVSNRNSCTMHIVELLGK